jgi:hypothetical protein
MSCVEYVLQDSDYDKEEEEEEVVGAVLSKCTVSHITIFVYS